VKAVKPIIHGRDHLAGGADPIPLLPPAGGTVDEIILATFPGAYYKLNETAGIWADSSGGGRDATYTGLGARGIPAPLDENDGSLCAQVNGTVPVPTTAPAAAIGTATDGMFVFAGVAPFTVSGLINPAVVPADHSDRSMGICGNVENPASSAQGWGLFILSHLMDPGATGGSYSGVPARVCFRRTAVSGGLVVQEAVGPSLAAGGWVRVTGVFDGTTMGLWLDDAQVASSSGTTASLPSGSAMDMFRIGDCGIAEGFGGNLAPFNGLIDSVIVWDRALTIEEIQSIVGSDPTHPVPGGEGDVLTSDGEGGTSWEPPSVEVSGGGVNPAPVDETPANSSHPAGSGPTTSTGWHLNAHVETVVLHDPNPGRFDVPTMKWVRVPFTSITIYRTWEPTVGATVLKTARLKDDRGLMPAAKNGILHINSDMAWPDAPPMNVYIDDDIVSHPEHHLVEGWFSIEYPVLDARYLPENDVELLTLGPTPDAPRPGVDVLVQDGYQRASRFMNLSTGSVLRFHAGSTDRSFGNWWFAGTADNSTGAGDGPGTGNLDNPFPIWGDWPARPIHMTPPYPQLNPTDSRAYYHDYQGMAGLGFGPYRGVTAGTNLSAGANLCMQAWQDTPWLLRFSTARFPAYRGFDQDYNGFPHLAVTYHYDPDTINHTTGKLLLPAT